MTFFLIYLRTFFLILNFTWPGPEGVHPQEVHGLMTAHYHLCLTLPLRSYRHSVSYLFIVKLCYVAKKLSFAYM